MSAVISLVVLYVAVRALRYTANQIEDFRKESQTQHFIEKVSHPFCIPADWGYESMYPYAKGGWSAVK